MYVDTADNIYTRIATGLMEAGKPMPPVGLLHLSPKGEVLDTIPPPSFPGEPTGNTGLMMPSKIWDLHPDGYALVGVSDRYVIELRKPEGTVRIEKAGERIAVRPEEKAEHDELTAQMATRYGTRALPMQQSLPDVKPFFKAIYAREDGTIWVRLYREAVRQEPPGGAAGPKRATAAALGRTNRLRCVRGRRQLPRRGSGAAGTILRTYSRHRLWATREAEQGEILVTRLRLVEPAE